MSRDSALRVIDYAFCLVSTAEPGERGSGEEEGKESSTEQQPKSSGVDAESVVVSCCSKFVEVLGLRTVFPLFMHSPRERVAAGAMADKTTTAAAKKGKSLGGPTAAEMEEHIIKFVPCVACGCLSSFVS